MIHFPLISRIAPICKPMYLCELYGDRSLSQRSIEWRIDRVSRTSIGGDVDGKRETLCITDCLIVLNQFILKNAHNTIDSDFKFVFLNVFAIREYGNYTIDRRCQFQDLFQKSWQKLLKLFWSNLLPLMVVTPVLNFNFYFLFS